MIHDTIHAAKDSDEAVRMNSHLRLRAHSAAKTVPSWIRAAHTNNWRRRFRY